MKGDVFAAIDPGRRLVMPTGGYTDTSETPSAGYRAKRAGAFSPRGLHFPFLVLVAVTAAVLYVIFEHGGAGARVEGHLGELEGDLGAGLKKD